MSPGAKVDLPLQDMFWGAYFCNMTDQFGMHWMPNCTSKAWHGNGNNTRFAQNALMPEARRAPLASLEVVQATYQTGVEQGPRNPVASSSPIASPYKNCNAIIAKPTTDTNHTPVRSQGMPA